MKMVTNIRGQPVRGGQGYVISLVRFKVKVTRLIRGGCGGAESDRTGGSRKGSSLPVEKFTLTQWKYTTISSGKTYHCFFQVFTEPSTKNAFDELAEA